MIKTIAFDFDGVIVDSNRMKYDVWFTLFPESEGLSRELIRDVLSRITQTRFDILRGFFTQAGRSPEEVEAKVEEYGAHYNTAVQKGILNSLVPGAKETLALLGENRKLYVNSATPEDALRETVASMGIGSYFSYTYGRPATKEENLEKIMVRENASASELLMIGDGEGDWEAARFMGCPFIGIANDWNGWEKREFPLVKDFRLLPQVIAELS